MRKAFVLALVAAVVSSCAGRIPSLELAELRSSAISEALKHRRHMQIQDSLRIGMCSLFDALDVDSLAATPKQDEVTTLMRGITSATCRDFDIRTPAPFGTIGVDEIQTSRTKAKIIFRVNQPGANHREQFELVRDYALGDEWFWAVYRITIADYAYK